MVPRLGTKSFEQAAGFLRIRGAANPLDDSAVHPETYPVVEKMAIDVGCSVADLILDPVKRAMIRPEKYVTADIGMPTLMDILNELNKPGRDPRGRIKLFEFSQEVQRIEDVKPGMLLPGIVTNITRFGAFVDIGVKQDGLVHVSQMADKFITDPAEVVKLHQHVQVKVLEVDPAGFVRTVLAPHGAEHAQLRVSGQAAVEKAQDDQPLVLRQPQLQSQGFGDGRFVDSRHGGSGSPDSSGFRGSDEL